VNDHPVANDDYIILLEDTTINTLNNGENSVLFNDTDPENDPLTATILTNQYFYKKCKRPPRNNKPCRRHHCNTRYTNI